MMARPTCSSITQRSTWAATAPWPRARRWSTPSARAPRARRRTRSTRSDQRSEAGPHLWCGPASYAQVLRHLHATGRRPGPEPVADTAARGPGAIPELGHADELGHAEDSVRPAATDRRI